MPRQEHTLPWYVPSWNTLFLSGHLTNKSTLTPWRRCRGGAARWVSGARWDKQHSCWSSSYSDSCHDLQWLTLHQRRLLLCQCQTFKITRDMDCIKFTDYFAFKSRTLRSHPYSLAIPQSRINAFRFSYFVNAPFIWNQLPSSILQSSSLCTFKFCLSKMLLSES